MFTLTVVSHYKNGLHRLQEFNLSYIIYTYICSGVPRPKEWGKQNINLIRRRSTVTILISQTGKNDDNCLLGESRLTVSVDTFRQFFA